MERVLFHRLHHIILIREPFVVSTEKLANYLQLTPSQLDEVANINEYFIEMQNASVKASAKLQAPALWQEADQIHLLYQQG